MYSSAGPSKITEIPLASTVTATVSVLEPSAEAAVITADPPETAVTKPSALTVATEVSLELQTTFGIEALLGRTDAES